MSDEEIEHGVFVPFINVQSVGGIFDDASFTAGYEMGLLDYRLFLARATVAENLFATIRSTNVRQADLIAMKHKYRIEQVHQAAGGEWVHCLFVLHQSIDDL